MKPLKSPAYTEKRATYTLWHQLPGHGMCPKCGQFGRCDGTVTTEEFKTQNRICPNGHRFQVVTRIDG